MSQTRNGRHTLVSLLCLVVAATSVACSSSTSTADAGGSTAPVGGALSGAADTHCHPAGGPIVQAVGICHTTSDQIPPNAAMCSVMFDTSATGAAGTAADDGGAVDYGPTLYNSEGDDDDCKYHVTWTSTPIRLDTDVTFDVTLTNLTDMKPVSCAGVRAEIFLGDSHAAPSPPQGTESAPGSGVYKVGPIKFDRSSTAATPWTVRFHFFEECNDADEDSPHGHAAFYISVPAPGSDGG